MADGKRKLLYDIAIAQTSFILSGLFGKFDPYSANPYRYEEVENLKTEEDKKLESEQGFKVLGNYLEKLAKNRRKL